MPTDKNTLKLAHEYAGYSPQSFDDAIPKSHTIFIYRALIAAEAELQERDKPVKVSFTDGALSSFCQCGVPLYPKWKFCPNCGRRLEWS